MTAPLKDIAYSRNRAQTLFAILKGMPVVVRGTEPRQQPRQQARQQGSNILQTAGIHLFPQRAAETPASPLVPGQLPRAPMRWQAPRQSKAQAFFAALDAAGACHPGPGGRDGLIAALETVRLEKAVSREKEKNNPGPLRG